MSVQEDIEKFKALLAGKKYYCSDPMLQTFDEPYLFTTELIDDYMRLLDVKDASVLTTGSSGDQILFSLLYGAKDVTCFDINPFAKYIFDLKVAYIKTLDYDQMYCGVLKYGTKLKGLLNPKHYEKIKDKLSGDSALFWQAAFDAGLSEQSQISFISYISQEYCKHLTCRAMYNKLKDTLHCKPINVDFITTHLRDLPQTLPQGKKFDIILLSNIMDFIDWWDSEYTLDKYNLFTDTVNTLSANNLNKNGIIQLGYAWDDNYDTGHHKDILQTFFTEQHIDEIILPGANATFFMAPNSTKSITKPAEFGEE